MSDLRRWIVVVAVLTGLVACASLRDRPTSEMVADMRTKERKIVRVSLDGNIVDFAQELESRGKRCTSAGSTSSGVAPTGSGGYVPVSISVRQRIDRGSNADGEVWLALRMDSLIHGIAFGVVLRQSDSSSVEAAVFPADSRKVDAIRQALVSGELFCAWRNFDYPYD